MSKTKTEILNHLQSIVQEKIDDLETAIHSLKLSRDSDSKSSAGDKHETSRAMAQIELDNLELQLSKNKDLQLELEKVNTSRVYDFIDFGSFVNTSNGYYFICIGLGKIILDQEEIFAISLGSPIGEILKNKKVGEICEFRNQKIEILEIL